MVKVLMLAKERGLALVMLSELVSELALALMTASV